MNSWIDTELQGCSFKDKRLGARFYKLMKQLSSCIGESIPMACQDWASIKAAYRFFSNENLSESELLEGHFQSTQSRCENTEGPILVLHDTTEISYKRAHPEKVGITRKCANKRDFIGAEEKRTKCGILMHASLALTPEGLPLGLSAIKFWTRKKFKGSTSLKRKINPTRVPIEKKESFRWVECLQQSTQRLGDSYRLVHITDRECDMYEFFAEASSTNSNFLVRMCVDRKISGGNSTIVEEMSKEKIKGVFEIFYRDDDGEDVKAKLRIKFKKITIQPPAGEKQKRYKNLDVHVIFAEEVGKAQGTREKIKWRLISDIPVNSLEEAIERLQWYALRWKVETFFKILKSGCKIEELKLRTAESLTKVISIYCILSWRIFWMTMLNRQSEEIPAEVALTGTEIKILDHLKTDKNKSKKYLSDYIIKIAKLGGYLARSSDPPPGNKVIWRGLRKLTEIMQGFEIGKQLVGN